MNKVNLPLFGSGLLILGLIFSFSMFHQRVQRISPEVANSVAKQPHVHVYGAAPLAFEANVGQTDAHVDFISRGRGHAIFLGATEAVFSLAEIEAAKSDLHGPSSSAHPNKERAVSAGVVHMRLAGANPHPTKTAFEKLPGKVNSFLGNDPAKWRTNVATYARVEYKNVYQGVDLIYYGNGSELEYDFVVAPGSDPRAIELGFQGAEKLNLDSQGNLSLQVNGRPALELRKPLVYQEKNGAREEIAGAFLVHGKQVMFELGPYDKTRPVIIDPVFAFSTRLGGSRSSSGQSIALDSSGNIYITGDTNSTDFPMAKGEQPRHGGSTDLFVTKLSADGSKLLYSTYIGGSGDDVGYGIAVDSAGNAYVTGDTSSPNFPVEKAFQKALGGMFDGFALKLSPDGSKLLYSTYIGGSQGDRGYAIAVDASANAYITGYTYSTDFPLLNPIQKAFTDGNVHCFVTKLDASGSALSYSTYLGGGNDRPDQATGIAVDSAGNAYVTGYTNSAVFPSVNAVQQFVGPTDIFVTKIKADGSGFVYSTHVGGNADDEGMAIAIDASGSAYVTGETESVNFPTTPGAYSTKCTPVPTPGPMRQLCSGGDAFVIKLTPDGSKLAYSTYINGKGFEVGRGIGVDSSGAVYVTGLTTSQDFPSVNPLQKGFGGGDFDAFVFKLSPDGSKLIYSSTLGGNQNDGGYGIATDSKGNAFVAGYTYSLDFPIKNPLKNGARSAIPAYRDVFVAKIKDE